MDSYAGTVDDNYGQGLYRQDFLSSLGINKRGFDKLGYEDQQLLLKTKDVLRFIHRQASKLSNAEREYTGKLYRIGYCDGPAASHFPDAAAPERLVALA